MPIRPYELDDRDAILDFALRAWAPVFASIEGALHPAVYQSMYPDWKASQRKAVEDVLANPEQRVWVLDRGGGPVGFVSVILHRADNMGEIHMLAVDPICQREGIGSALTQHAVEWIRECGMEVAMISTGGDPGHAPARRTYERAGFRAFPVVQFYKKL